MLGRQTVPNFSSWLSHNVVTLQDDIFSIFSSEVNREFFTPQVDVSYSKPYTDQLRTASIFLSSNVIEHKRVVYGLFDLIRDLGGLFIGLYYSCLGALRLLALIGFSPIT